MIEVGVLELRDCEKISRFFHCRFQLLELLPVVVEISAVSHKVHFNVEIQHKVIELFYVGLQIGRLSLQLDLPVFEPALLTTFN